jgi:hypothetical protein
MIEIHYSKSILRNVSDDSNDLKTSLQSLKRGFKD